MKAGDKKGGKLRSHLAKVPPKVAAVGTRFGRIGILLCVWLVEVCAFVLLPLVIYVVTFLSLGRSVWDALNSPEVMFVTIILYGEVLKKQVLFYREFRGFVLKFTWALAWGVLGMTISSVLLCFSLLSHEAKELNLSGAFKYLKGFAFLCALFLSAFEKISTGLVRGEDQTYGTLEKRPEAVREHG